MYIIPNRNPWDQVLAGCIQGHEWQPDFLLGSAVEVKLGGS